MSSAIDRSRANHCAKRSRSGRIDSNRTVRGARASAARDRSPMEETGDGTWELRLIAGGKNRGDYMCAARPQWQYRASPPGLYAHYH